MHSIVTFRIQADTVVGWLGFCLRRNPFITLGGLDNVAADTRSSKATNDPTPGHISSRLPEVKHQQSKKTQLRAKSAALRPPPTQLVLPLASILPSDDPVHGSRICAAQKVLLEEESMHGQVGMLQSARKQLSTCQRVLNEELTQKACNPVVNQSVDADIYEEFEAVSSRLA